VEHSSTLQWARFAFGGPFQPAEVPGCIRKVLKITGQSSSTKFQV
jgi:hypothetical protein